MADQPSKKTILLCRIDGNFGGVERYILTLAKSLDRERYHPIVAVIANRGELSRQAQLAGIQTEFIPMKNRLDGIEAARTLTRIARDRQCHLIHTFGIRSNTLAAMMRLVHSIPWVIRLPNVNRYDYANPLVGSLSHWFNNQLIYKADALQVISPQLEAYVQSWEIKPKQIFTIFNGVDVSVFQPRNVTANLREQLGIDWNTFVIGTTGRLDPIKGYDVLIKAFYQLIQKNPNLVLLILGDGPQKQELLELIDRLGVSKRVMLTGYIESIVPYLQLFDLFVCSSRSEGVPMSVLEAMAMRLPIICTRVGGIESVLGHQREGILIEPDNESAIVNAVCQLVDDHSLRESLASNAYRKALNEFTNEQMAKQVEAMYDRLIADYNPIP